MKAALITGASSGIGMELAKEFAKDRHDLVLIARSGEKLEALANDLKKTYDIKVITLARDLSKHNIANEIYDELKAERIEVEYLVNNAGFGDFGMFFETNWKKEEEMIDLNIKTLTHLTKLFLPDMIAQRSGRILNVASTAAFQPGPLMAVYYATKAYVLFFSEAIANELKGSGITVTALCPGPTLSGFQKAAANEDSKLVKGRKLPTAAEVAKYGYKAMMQGRTVAIHGFMNRLIVFFIRLSPRNMVTRLVRKMSEKK